MCRQWFPSFCVQTNACFLCAVSLCDAYLIFALISVSFLFGCFLSYFESLFSFLSCVSFVYCPSLSCWPFPNQLSVFVTVSMLPRMLLCVDWTSVWHFGYFFKNKILAFCLQCPGFGSSPDSIQNEVYVLWNISFCWPFLECSRRWSVIFGWTREIQPKP